MDAGPYAAAQARRAVVGWLGEVLDHDRLQDVKLLVSELVTNGIRYAPATDGIELRGAVRRDGHVRVEVSDGGGRFVAPAPVEPPMHQRGGRGLVIVDRIAAEWGTSHNGRNTVWFEV
jgi:anti-sigma regulatory factor (Ser/Thr protein kinase)